LVIVQELPEYQQFFSHNSLLKDPVSLAIQFFYHAKELG